MLLAVMLFGLPLAAFGALTALSGISSRAARLDLGLLDNTIGELPPQKALPADSMVFDRSGNLIAYLHPPGETRLPIGLNAVSPWLQKATVDIEDRNFWHEGAVDPRRILGAAWNDFTRDGPIQGASTITQQLAKIEYLNATPTVARKVREIFVAQHLESTMSKRQILEAYLNDIPYGHGATGVQAAAHTYFDRDADKLDLAQSALLAGLPDAPSELDPFVHADAAKRRQLLVLQAMLQAGDVTTAQAADALADPLTYANGNTDNLNVQPAFVARVRGAIANELKVDPDQAGLRISATLDPTLQSTAQQAVMKQVQALKGNNVTDGAVVTVDPGNGAVLAYVGSAGPDVPGGQIDMAAVPRQPGSTFKLFTYSTAISQRKVTMLTPVLDAPFSLKTGGGPFGMSTYNVTDYDQRYHGLMPVELALGNSLNVPAVRVEMYTGIANIVNTARALGVTTLDEPPESYTPSLTLGAYPIPLWQLAQAATVFANQGKLQPMRFVSSVKDASGRELMPAPAPLRQALDPGTVFIMNQVLSNDANRVLEFGRQSALTIPNHLVAAKTGTTNDFKDNLTVGWTPKVVTAAWVGNADNRPMQGTTGVTGAAPIWHEVMIQALSAVPTDDWTPAPPGLQSTQFEGHQGYLLNGTAVSWIPDLTGGASSYATPTPSASSSASPSVSPTVSQSAVSPSAQPSSTVATPAPPSTTARPGASPKP